MSSNTATTLKAWGHDDLTVVRGRRPGRTKGQKTWFEVDGRAVPPLKPALGMINKPAMYNYAKKRAFDSITKVMGDAIGVHPPDVIIARAKEAFEEKGRDYSVTMGRLIREHQTGQEPVVPKSHADAWATYLEWVKAHGIAIEYFTEPEALLAEEYGVLIDHMGWRGDRPVPIHFAEANNRFAEGAIAAHAIASGILASHEEGIATANGIWVFRMGKDAPTFEAINVHDSFGRGIEALSGAVRLYTADIDRLYPGGE